MPDEQRNTPQETALEKEIRMLHDLSTKEEWIIAKKRLADKMLSLTSILDMEEKLLSDPIELKARKKASNLINEWIAEVDGAQLSDDTMAPEDGDHQDHILRTGQP